MTPINNPTAFAMRDVFDNLMLDPDGNAMLDPDVLDQLEEDAQAIARAPLRHFQPAPASLYSREICVICQDNIGDGPALAHESEADASILTHPHHEECLRTWLRRSPHCPICRVECDIATVPTPSRPSNVVLWGTGTSLMLIANTATCLAERLLSTSCEEDYCCTMEAFVRRSASAAISCAVIVALGNVIRSYTAHRGR